MGQSKIRLDGKSARCRGVPAPREKLESSTIDFISIVIADTYSDDAAFQLVFLIGMQRAAAAGLDIAHLDSESR